MNQIETLMHAGFEPSLAQVYTALVELGPSQVPSIMEKTGLSRAGVYDALTSLLANDYITYAKKGKKAIYSPAHPEKLRDLLAQRKRDVALLEGEMNETIRGLIGSYNITLHKPGVSFYEGKEGIIKAYDELLEINKPIDSIEDKGEMGEFIPEYAKKFVKKRVEKGITNRVVAPNTNVINISSKEELRETRTIDQTKFPFGMDVKICGDTLLLITLKEKEAVGIKISHPEIADNFRILFEYLWNQAALRRSS